MFRLSILVAFTLAGTLPQNAFCGVDDTRLYSQRIYETGGQPRSVVCADFNSDGVQDLATANGENSVILFGLGGGEFSQAFEFSPYAATGILEKDLNRDGNPDLIVASESEHRVFVYFGDGFGGFDEVATDVDLSNDSFTFFMLVEDFNGDQVFDLVFSKHCSPYQRSINILFGKTDGTFDSLTEYPFNSYPLGLAAGDLNGDSILDLAVAAESQLAVLLGIGDGTFEQPQYHDTMMVFAGIDVLISDVNSDEIPDVLVPPALFLGLGDGTFCPPSVIYGSSSSFAECRDVNGDGAVDLIADYNIDHAITVLTGNGDGTFRKIQTFSVGSSALGICCVDVDGDNDLDIAVANAGSYSIGIVELLADGSFDFVPSVPLLFNPGAMVNEDINGDGNADIIATQRASDCITVLSGLGDGNFRQQATYATNQPRDMVYVDLNNDGIKDIATVNSEVNELDGVSIFLGVGDGRFVEGQVYSSSFHFIGRLAAGDMNGDGALDLVAWTGDAILQLPGKGDGTFGNFNILLEVESRDFRIADVNQDETLDLVTIVDVEVQACKAIVFIGNGDGTYQVPTVSPPTLNFRCISLDVADVNNDGVTDIMVGAFGTEIAVLIGNNRGGFELPFIIDLVNQIPFELEAVDVNLDGHIDIASLNWQGNLLSISVGRGDGTFEHREIAQVGDQPHRLTVGDFNNDRYPDVAVGSFTGLNILLNQTPSRIRIGDVNRDCLLNLLDIAPFIDLLSTGAFQAEADINGDLSVDLNDVMPFVTLLIGQ